MPQARLAVSEDALDNVRQMIRWDTQEKEQLAVNFARFRLDRPLAPLNEILAAAEEETFAPERRRHLNGLGDKPLRELVLAKCQQLVGEKQTPIIIEKEVTAPVDAKQILNDMPLPDLMALAVRRLFAEGATMVHLMNAGMLPARDENGHTNGNGNGNFITRRPVFSDRKEKLKIIICSVTVKQQQIIQSKVPDDVELLFREGRQIHDMSKSADFCIITRWTKHEAWDTARKLLQSKNVIFHDGGVDGVIKKVMDLRSQHLSVGDTMVAHV